MIFSNGMGVKGVKGKGVEDEEEEEGSLMKVVDGQLTLTRRWKMSKREKFCLLVIYISKGHSIRFDDDDDNDEKTKLV